MILYIMFLKRLLHSHTGKVMLSIILGLGIASLFRYTCKGKNCVLRFAPPLDEIKGHTFKYDGKCYSYEPKQAKCDTEKEILVFK